MLAGVIGERNVYRYGALEAAARYVEDAFRAAGYPPAAQEFTAHLRPVRNIEAEIIGSRRPERIWILGGHYDSVMGSPGADDNASAVAGVLEAARLLAGSRPRDTIRFVTFVNEEPPFYKGPQMGSVVYAKRCRERGERIEGMVNLDWHRGLNAQASPRLTATGPARTTDHAQPAVAYFDSFSITVNSACVPSLPRPAAWALVKSW